MTTIPEATYRLQLGEHLDFAAAADLVPYLADLGVTHLYLSPILTARAGSTHGYDVADPQRVADALGGEEGLRELAAAAGRRGLGLVVDIVPNHLGTGPDNPLWEELLASGRRGPAAPFFDVDWEPPLPGARDKVILPILGDTYGRVLHAGEIEVVEDGSGILRGPRVRYHEHSLPLSASSAAWASSAAGGLAGLRGTPGDPASWEALHELLEAQHYRLVHWRAGGQLINYRRFFAIDELAGVRVEDPSVFAHNHERILALVADGVIEGLRVDHPDGLRDPARYLARLAEATGGAWTVVEKILEPGETLPDWPTAGTTGYEFGNDVLGLYVDPDARSLLNDLDQSLGGAAGSYTASAVRAKGEVLDGDLAADAGRLARRLWALAQSHREIRDIAARDCLEVVARALQSFDVYRTYVDPETAEARGQDTARIDAAVARAGGTLADGSTARAPAFLYGFLADVLTGRAGDSPAHLEVIARFQQLSGAVMAKGTEDTALYRDRRLVAVNEVGGDPERLGLSVDAFHRANAVRARRHPTGMLTTTTHDTKRGEDVRLRIAALSELGERWTTAARSWHERNADLVIGTRNGPAPDAQTELLLYQTLVAVWPLDSRNPSERLRDRVVDYLIKASREAKERTDWSNPDQAFEDGVESFVDAILDAERSAGFLDSVREVAEAAAEIAMVSGLGQTLLRATAPGVCDTYQGMELWGDNLVDPDNRRPVDFHRCRALLADLEGAEAAELFAHRRDGRIKMWVLSRALRTRAALPETFAGGYTPFAVEGRWAANVVAFGRDVGGKPAVVIAPRLPGQVLRASGGDVVGGAWADTAVVLAEGLEGQWVDALTGRRHDSPSRIALSSVLDPLPVALLVRPGD